MNEAFEPCTNERCENEECLKRAEHGKTLEQLREEFGANSLEYYRKQADEFAKEAEEHKAKAERYERFYGNKIQAISNFETAVKELLEEDDETVSWDSLERALQYLDIEVTSLWTATFTVEFRVEVRARAEDKAREIIDSVYEFSVNDREIDDYSTESYDWSDLQRND